MAISRHRRSSSSIIKSTLYGCIGFLGLILAIICLIYLWPLRTATLTHTRIRPMTYQQAVRAAATVRANDIAAGVLSDCLSTLYTHGAPTASVVVMFHGVGACP